MLLHGKVFAYYGGTVSIGVDVDDETDWGEVNQMLDAIAVPPAPAAHPRGASQTARWRETATERSR